SPNRMSMRAYNARRCHPISRPKAADFGQKSPAYGVPLPTGPRLASSYSPSTVLVPRPITPGRLRPRNRLALLRHGVVSPRIRHLPPNDTTQVVQGDRGHERRQAAVDVPPAWAADHAELGHLDSPSWLHRPVARLARYCPSSFSIAPTCAPRFFSSIFF